MTTAINGTPRPIHPPQPAMRITARRTNRTRPSRRRALAVAITAALLAAVGTAIDAATTTAANPTSPATSSRPIGAGATHLPSPPLSPTGIGPAPLGPGASI
jgi:hypothetical protein